MGKRLARRLGMSCMQQASKRIHGQKFHIFSHVSSVAVLTKRPSRVHKIVGSNHARVAVVILLLLLLLRPIPLLMRVFKPSLFKLGFYAFRLQPIHYNINLLRQYLSWFELAADPSAKIVKLLAIKFKEIHPKRTWLFRKFHSVGLPSYRLKTAVRPIGSLILKEGP